MSIVFREPNRAKWVGVLPGCHGDQIAEDGSATNGTTTLYTVAASKLLLVTSINFSCSWTGGGGIQAYMGAFDGTPTLQYRFAWTAAQESAATPSWGYGFYFPFELPAGYSIRVYSGGASMRSYGGFTGILIDV